MPILLSLSAAGLPHHGERENGKAEYGAQLWAAGPEGLFLAEPGGLTPVPQPHQQPACCLAVEDRLLTGGAPFGVAWSRDGGASWQASWMDGVDARVVALVADPRVEASGVLLAGTEGGGVLRSANRGEDWTVCNYGLHNYMVLALAWAPPPPARTWPAWDVAFAGTEDGLYRSPNGGRGWRRAAGVPGVVLAVAVGPEVHTDGVVLAGTETEGLWRSTDGGHSFAPVAGAPPTVNALAAVPGGGWLLSDADGLWRSPDGLAWTPVPDSEATLALLVVGDKVLAAGETGVFAVA